MKKMKRGEEIDVLGDDRSWDQWQDIGDDISGPLETDHYNGPHGIKEDVVTFFQTILQCILATTAMDRDYFKRLATQSNKYARTQMCSLSSSMFHCHKWENTTVTIKGLASITRRSGPKQIKVAVPGDIEKPQNYMGGVDRGGQHRVMVAGYSNVAHFKKWYKKAYLGITNFSMLNNLSAWILSVGYTGVRRGIKTGWCLVK